MNFTGTPIKCIQLLYTACQQRKAYGLYKLLIYGYGWLWTWWGKSRVAVSSLNNHWLRKLPRGTQTLLILSPENRPFGRLICKRNTTINFIWKEEFIAKNKSPVIKSCTCLCVGSLETVTAALVHASYIFPLNSWLWFDSQPYQNQTHSCRLRGVYDLTFFLPLNFQCVCTQ